MKNWFFVAVIILTFIFLRWFNLDHSLYFQNDMGRDFLVLYDWQQSGKPPLLGPQNSQIGFNQSPIYFYFFFPLFILSQHSLYTTNIILTLIYLSTFCIGVYYFRKDSTKLIILTLLGLLFTIQPQMILQQRYIWNPSFVPLFLAVSYVFFLQMQIHFSKKNVLLFGLALGLAVGMNLSAIPALIGYLFLTILLFRKDLKKLLLSFLSVIIGLILVFLPVIIFEIKYQFQMSKRVIDQISSGGISSAIPIWGKTVSLSELLLQSVPFQSFVLLVLIGICFFLAFKAKKTILGSLEGNANAQALFLFLVSSSLIILAPFPLEAHYIFASLTFLLIMISTLPQKAAIITSVMLVYFWLQPALLTSYFLAAPRSLAQTTSCLETFCQQQTEPLFVSVISNTHNYHYGPEFRYLLKEYGCQIKNIETEPMQR